MPWKRQGNAIWRQTQTISSRPFPSNEQKSEKPTWKNCVLWVWNERPKLPTLHVSWHVCNRPYQAIWFCRIWCWKNGKNMILGQTNEEKYWSYIDFLIVFLALLYWFFYWFWWFRSIEKIFEILISKSIFKYWFWGMTFQYIDPNQ